MSPILIDLGFIEIRWYSVLILCAFIIGYFLVINRSKKSNISLMFINDLSFYLIIFCILGARLYYCLFNLDYYLKNIFDIFKINIITTAAKPQNPKYALSMCIVSLNTSDTAINTKA